ncbi:ParB/RepB/Spo0J family partition protein [Massilia pinisoli]|uniref:ParB/RepB/Spo0J family partition protein n=1 Tax=Massilia pinisoli TaxID=1772194 RepID=A0ABT1ZZR9_9BURK|nr:ParB/RepB/Spo0J family partition protein [Massilia pinisoli]MCS0585432.1 ParB/RepB/Spo0J family partition protein [Massilia pinisoli]
MNLDLTGLAEIGRPAAGEPLPVPLDAISYDSNQPRKHLEEAALLELAESIRAIGVVQPISIRPDPVAPGRYIINYGERRHRASVIAGMQTIPAFVHKAPDDYMQVAENLHRADLSPMEMALFIKRRLDAGEKKNEIAAKLGYKNGYVTEHLALLEAPPCVEKAYANGATSARTLYDLRRLHDVFPEQVDAWCASGVEVTRDTVEALAQKFRRDEILTNDPELRVPSSASSAHDVHIPASTGDATATGPSSESHTASASVRGTKPVVATRPTGRSSTRLLIRVQHGGRRATVHEDSVVLIRYDDGGTAEVPLANTIVLGTAAV